MRQHVRRRFPERRCTTGRDTTTPREPTEATDSGFRPMRPYSERTATEPHTTTRRRCDVREHESNRSFLASAVRALSPLSPRSEQSEWSREGIQRPRELLAVSPPRLLPLRSNEVVRFSPRLRRYSSVVRNGFAVSSSRKSSVFRTTTRSAHRRLGPSVYLVGVGHSEPPVKGSRLQSLEPSPERFAFWWANETRCVS